jgi:hypothetical protein
VLEKGEKVEKKWKKEERKEETESVRFDDLPSKGPIITT